MSKQRVLFVDVEIAILEGLERRLSMETKRRDRGFASRGTAALSELARAPSTWSSPTCVRRAWMEPRSCRG